MGCGASTSTGAATATVQQRDAADESARSAIDLHLEQALRDGNIEAVAASNLQLGESVGYMEWKHGQAPRAR